MRFPVGEVQYEVKRRCQKTPGFYTFWRKNLSQKVNIKSVINTSLGQQITNSRKNTIILISYRRHLKLLGGLKLTHGPCSCSNWHGGTQADRLQTLTTEDLGSIPYQTVWDLWLTKWRWRRIFKEFFTFHVTISFNKQYIFVYYKGHISQKLTARAQRLFAFEHNTLGATPLLERRSGMDPIQQMCSCPQTLDRILNVM